MRRTIIALVATLAVAITACTAGPITEPSDTTATTRPQQGPGPAGSTVFAAHALQSFDSCTEFLDYVRGHAVDRVGPYGLDPYGLYGFGESVEEFAADAELSTTAATTSRSVSGIDYSGTNVQAAGVDEPDIVKTDGDRIFVVGQSRLFWIDASGTPEIVASIPLAGWGQRLFLSGDRLLVMTSENGYGIEPFIDGGVAFDRGQGRSQRVVLTEVDVSDPTTMEAITTLTLDGSILSSRMTDGSIRVVIRSGPVGFDW